jgi:hypothetical protein
VSGTRNVVDMKKHHLVRWAAALLALVVPLTQGCDFGGSSEEKERVYGTPVSADQFFPPDSPTTANLSKEAKVAQCLTDKGAVMYGTEWCPATQHQKTLFRDGFSYVKYVDCDKQESLCAKKGIRSYPTWICRDRSISGSYPLEALAVFAGCD